MKNDIGIKRARKQTRKNIREARSEFRDSQRANRKEDRFSGNQDKESKKAKAAFEKYKAEKYNYVTSSEFNKL